MNMSNYFSYRMEEEEEKEREDKRDELMMLN